MVLLPVVQADFPFFREKPLGGAYTFSARPSFSWAGLRGNTFQDSLQRYLEDRLGFRPSLIRLRNQVDFSLFRVVNSPGIVVGHHGVLFETRQLQSYLGKDRLPEDAVRVQVRRFRIVQRDLARRGVQLLFVMAPNKARFQPENLPEHWQQTPGTVTNYDLYRQALQADTVAVLDFVPLMARWKKTSPYPLFATGGTHWSGYGSALAADTLLRRLAQMGGVRFPGVRTVGRPLIVRAADSLPGNDYDLGGTLNLLKETENTPLAYPQLAFDAAKPGQTQPPALFIADSFIWGLCQFAPFLGNAFSDDTRYWYYGKDVHKPDQALTPVEVVSYGTDLRRQLESRRFIVLLVTEHNLVKQEFDFTNQVYQLYHPLTAADSAAIDQLTQKLMAEELTQHPDSAWARQAKGGDAYLEQMRRKAEAVYQNQL
ncbi:alginate O-acetyltransferase AlgX-related protein [Hymenobacter convexus]|uniref:alginate O-acetyltransferase AlgX-related protein n=1 Tax=Hymenobacter sp. CA1UV-4 TaxID=3063782 RepID=UPI002712CAAE|nr:hypothetical protein [Hymenobacter sp. CA1UV-4]MDO7850301.1 hypothetical protein [Hymenobacter sp. CA1UV-4]